MIRKSMLALGVLALSAMGATYHLSITSPTWVGTTQLKPGEYSLEVQGDKVMLKSGKNLTEIPAKVETESTKYDYTSLHITNTDGKNTLEEIWVGGTKTKIVVMK